MLNNEWVQFNIRYSKFNIQHSKKKSDDSKIQNITNSCHSEILCGGLRGDDEESPESVPLCLGDFPQRDAFGTRHSLRSFPSK